jgi:hypothetical protein
MLQIVRELTQINHAKNHERNLWSNDTSLKGPGET